MPNGGKRKNHTVKTPGASKKSRDAPERKERPNNWVDMREPSEKSPAALDFAEYYKRMNIVPEARWEEFMGKLKERLPITFRINGFDGEAQHFRDQMIERYIKPLTSEPIEIDGEVIEPPSPLPFYPDNFAWTFNVSRSDLRKRPELTRFWKFLVENTEKGLISRLETVSMLPVLFLDVRPGQAVSTSLSLYRQRRREDTH
jgi:16S rRNA C967 or C1407 C5-methylase (RsmB/RsmF family)